MDLLYSKKFQMAVIGIIVTVITSFIPEIDKVELTAIVTLIVANILGQGLADFGKEAK
jgi:hypothetical protein